MNNMNVAFLPACLLSLSLTACMTVGEDYAGPPSVAANARHFARNGDNLGVERLQLAPWWDSLGDPELTRLIQLALKDSPNVQAAKARLAQARAGLEQKQDDTMPKVSVSALGGGLDIAPGSNQQQIYHAYSAAALASWEIDLFGGLRRGVEAASADSDAVAADLVDTQLSLAAEVGNQYIELRRIQAEGKLLQAQQDADRTALELVRQQRSQGVAGEQSVQQRVSQLAATQGQIEQLEANRLGVLDKLALLCGQEPASLDPELEKGAGASLPALPQPILIGDPATLIQQRPDIRAAERRLAASQARIGEQKANYFPKLTLIGGGSLFATSSADLFKKTSVSLLGGPSLSWDVFDFNRTTAAVGKARATYDEALADYRRHVLQALNDANSALSKLGRQKQVLLQQSVQLSSAQNQWNLLSQRYQAGVASRVELADSTRSLNDARRQETLSRAELLEDYILLQKSLGMGWLAGGEPASKPVSK